MLINPFSLVKPIISDTNLFSFSDFMSALAILIIILTITDIRYRFRVAVAPFPLTQIVYIVCFFTGITLLITDFLYEKKYRVPLFLSDSLMIQLMLGALIFISFFLWISFASSRSLAIFRKWNAKRYYKEVEAIILKGSTEEMSVVSQELLYSASFIIGSLKSTKIEFSNEKVKEDVKSQQASKRHGRA